MGHWDWVRRGKSPNSCRCIPWDMIRDDPYDVKCERPYEEEGDILRDFDFISARRGNSVGRAHKCQDCPGAGTYIRTCNAFGHWDGVLGGGCANADGPACAGYG